MQIEFTREEAQALAGLLARASFDGADAEAAGDMIRRLRPDMQAEDCGKPLREEDCHVDSNHW